MSTEEMIKKIEKINSDTPEGNPFIADYILVELMQNCDCDFTGISQDIFNIWMKSSDKEAVEQMFYDFTDQDYDSYLMTCIKESPENLFIDEDSDMSTEEMINKIEKLNSDTPEGISPNADYILAKLMQNCDCDFTGISQDIFNIWKKSLDREAVEQIFYDFTNLRFACYLETCIDETAS